MRAMYGALRLAIWLLVWGPRRTASLGRLHGVTLRLGMTDRDALRAEVAAFSTRFRAKDTAEARAARAFG
jgi:hypothetical protein